MEKIKSLFYNSNSSEIKETQVTVLFFFFFLKRVVKSRPLDFLIFLVGKSVFLKDKILLRIPRKYFGFSWKTEYCYARSSKRY